MAGNIYIQMLLLSRLFASASAEASEINRLFKAFLIMACIIFLLVAGMVLIGVFRYRKRQTAGEPPQIAGNNVLEITWTVIPFLTLVIFFFVTLHTMNEIERPRQARTSPDILITGHQWWWDLRYLRDQVVTANELHIPVGRQLLLQIESADVIHDWWVPELGRKMDAIPGKSNFLWIEADRPGTFAGSCNEYCGGEHAWMRIRVIAQVPEDFDRWLREQKHPPPVPADSIGEAGARIFLGKACSGCHAIAGTPAQSHIGPELSHVASRETLGAGVLTNTPENMTRWMKDPQKVKPGARMPDFKLNEDELTCLVTYLEGLK